MQMNAKQNSNRCMDPPRRANPTKERHIEAKGLRYYWSRGDSDI